MRGIARDNLIEVKEKSKLYYDKKINPQNFKIGDYVFLLGELKKFENACSHLSSAQARTKEGRYMHIFYPIL